MFESKRRHQRVKRRFACDFLAEGQRYRGIIVELSSSGLFVQTDATIAPGSEIDLHLAGAGPVPGLRIRGVVVRRRMVPAPLAAVVRRGIALEILEAPREYGLACGSELLDAPIRLSRGDGRDSGSGSAAAVPDDPTDRAAAATFPAPAPLAEVLEAVQRPEAAPRVEADPPGSPRPEALVVDDGTLGDVVELLRELGVDLRTLSVGTGDASPSFAWPTRLLLTTARLACSLALPEPPEDEAVVAVAVAEDESQTLSTLMRRLGFQFLVHRPIHPAALRVLLSKILYRGAEQRRAERLAFGAEVSWRTGWATRRGVLVEISATGCRLQAERPLRPGARIRIAIPPEATGDRRIALRGRVLRRDPGSALSSGIPHGLAVGFDPPSTRVQRRLDALLVRLARGPAALARGAPAGAAAPTPTVSIVPEVEPQLAAHPPAGDRRLLPRGRLGREVVALDATGTCVLHALVGRDFSPAGMRSDPHPDLALHERLRLALYEPSEAQPLVFEAEVSRDDGEAGLALRFLDLAPELVVQLERIARALPAVESLRPEPQRIMLGEFFSDRSVA